MIGFADRATVLDPLRGSVTNEPMWSISDFVDVFFITPHNDNPRDGNIV